MSERIHVLAQQLFGKSSVDECDLQEVKDLANRYPYFAPAQFLLVEKLKKENSPEYPAQLQKAVLYYHNPLEFEYFIDSERFESELDLEDNFPAPEADIQDKEEVLETALPSNEEITEPDVEPTNIDEIVSNPAKEETVNVPAAETVVSDEESSYTNTEEEILPSAVEEKMSESIERVLEQEEAQIKAPPPASSNDMVFEPYHTVDYFASQGIKLSQEETPKDKFGKQLKSFTEWLKTMKRLPPKEISKNVDTTSESKVEHLAADSVHDADVVTEAMAEVWIKQGNREKAIETYNKLGLLNPSKKAYFAGLIENLKRS